MTEPKDGYSDNSLLQLIKDIPEHSITMKELGHVHA